MIPAKMWFSSDSWLLTSVSHIPLAELPGKCLCISVVKMAEPRPLILLLMLSLAPISCARRKMGPGELERTRRFSEIIKREDRRTLGDDDFFPQNLRASPYPVVREWCALALGRIGDPRALPWLDESFRSTYAGIAAAAAFAVGEIEDR